MKLRDIAAVDAAFLDRLIDSYGFKPYRNYRILSRRRQTTVMRAELDRILQTPDHVAFVVEENEGTAMVCGRPLAWDSQFFGIPMGRLDALLRETGAPPSALRAAVDGGVERLRGLGIRHVAVKVDAADSVALTVVEDAGFRLMDSLVTYIAHPKRPPPRRVKEVGIIRPFVSTDTDQVLEITREAYQGFRGRFQVDPHLPRDRSDEFYIEWARKCCTGAMADRIYVADDGQGHLFGWASVKKAEPVSSIGGATISSGSLGACRPDRPGAYAGLIRAAAMDNYNAGVLTEAMTQSSNFSMVRVLEAVGAQYARAEYTFHAWLGS